MTGCSLCGVPTPDPPVTASGVDGAFCCRGCLEVSRALGDVDDPAAALEPDEAPSAPEDAETVQFDVRGMHCTTCEAFLESRARERDGVYTAAANYAADALEIRYDAEETDAGALADAVSGFGYRAARSDAEAVRDRSRDAQEFARMRVFLAAFLGMAVMGAYAVFLYPAYLGYHWSGLLATPSAAISLFGPIVGVTTLELVVVGYPVFRGAYVAARAGHLNMDVLVALGALVPYLYSLAAYFYGGNTVVYFDVSVAVLTVVTVGNYVEDVVKRRTADGLGGTRTRASSAVRVLGAGETERVPVDALESGDRVRVDASDRVPLDGTVVAGSATVDESLLTGESRPHVREPGDEVPGGAALLDGTLTVDVGPDAESTLDRIVASMRHVRSSRSGAQRLADTLASVFVPLVVLAAAVTSGLWFVVGASLPRAVLTGVAVLVVSCPCSLGLATPLALLAGVRAAADRDVAVVTPAALEGFADADVVAFDKTGTLTTGAMRVDSLVTDGPEAVVRARAAAAEADAAHPAADAIRTVGPESPPDAADTRVEGRSHGVSAVVEGDRVTVGHPSLFAEAAWPAACQRAVEDARSGGALPVVVGWNERVHGVYSVTDEPRANWERVVERVHDTGSRVVVLTGDDASRVERYETHENVDEVFAEVPPEGKAAVVRRLAPDGTTVMVGDGTNDAPALAAADLGVAFSSGTDVALEAADAVVRRDDLSAIEDVFAVARTTRRRVRGNLAWAFAYNAVALPLAALGLVTPLVASVAMGASSLVVVGNATRDFEQSE